LQNVSVLGEIKGLCFRLAKSFATFALERRNQISTLLEKWTSLSVDIGPQKSSRRLSTRFLSLSLISETRVLSRLLKNSKFGSGDMSRSSSKSKTRRPTFVPGESSWDTRYKLEKRFLIKKPRKPSGAKCNLRLSGRKATSPLRMHQYTSRAAGGSGADWVSSLDGRRRRISSLHFLRSTPQSAFLPFVSLPAD